MTGLAVLQRRTTTPDGVLVQEAAAGSGVSYGELYDRYAEQVFNYCLRVTGSPEDASDATQEAFVNVLRRLQADDRPVLEFSPYLFAAARHESYALMRQRARAQPTDSLPAERGRVADVDSDPERSVLLRDSQEAVRVANAQLGPRHREVLALREVAGQSYDEIGQTMGITENAAAQLIFRARSKLREALTAGAVASVVATSEECAAAQALLNMVQDGEYVEEADRVWLEEHLDECDSCKTANRMLLEVSASYRCWLPVALFAGMRTETLTRAGELVGADWSHVPVAGKGSGGASGGGGGGVTGATAAATATAAVIAAAAIGGLALLRDDETAPVDPVAEKPAVSAPKRAETSAAKPNPDAHAMAAGGKIVAARAPGSLRAPALSASPVDAPGRTDEVDAPDTGYAPPMADRPQERTPPSDEDRGQPLGSETNPPAPPEPVMPAPRGQPPAPLDSVPTKPRDPPVAPPTPLPDTDCTFPGRRAGPDQCPPGHGGDAPGHGGDPPGHGGDPPGQRASGRLP